jgi:ferritin
MKSRRSSLLNGTIYGDAILMYKPGDVVKPVVVTDQMFTGVVRDVDTKTNKITVAWGGGPESQHDPDEIMPMPFFGGNKDAAKTSSFMPIKTESQKREEERRRKLQEGVGVRKSGSDLGRRMRADVSDIVDVPEIGVEVVEESADSAAQTDFVPEDMEVLLNRQVGAEFYSSYLYYMIAAICQSKGLVGFQNWFESQGDDEIDHAMKVYNYLVDTGSTLVLPTIPGPVLDAGMEIIDLTRLVLDHEMGVTQDWNRIGQLAKQQDNPATSKLVMDFLSEQIEEEDAALTLHQKVQLADTGSGLLMIDTDLRDRSPIAKTASGGKELKRKGYKETSARMATNPPMDQFCGEPDTHGLYVPVSGGTSVMKDLAYQLYDEANEFADVNPRVASIKAGLKELAFESSTSSCPECEMNLFLRKATSGNEPSAQRTVEEEIEKISSVSRTALNSDLVKKIMQYEDGGMDQNEIVEFFQELIDSGTIHHLQGSYGRVAEQLIRRGLCHRRGQSASSIKATGEMSMSDIQRSRRSMYWCAPDRTFRLTQQEQESGSATCPKCRVEMNKEKFTRSDKLLTCPTCGFKVPTSKAVTKIEVKVPDGVEVDVTTKNESGQEAQGEAVIASGQKYKGYTIEKSGDNFFVKDSSGHRAFGEVPASVEMAKKWIDQAESGKRKAGDVMLTRRGRFAYVDSKDLADLPRMTLSQIASLIYTDWKNVNYGAKPYLEAMSSLQNVSDMYGQDSGISVVAYFLSNAAAYKGETAKAIKKELQRRIRRG